MIDSDAMTTIYDEHSFAMYKYAYRLCREKQSAEDIAADAFIKLVEQINKGIVVGNVRSYLYQTVYHDVINLYRRDKQSAPLELVENSADNDMRLQQQVENRLMSDWFISMLSEEQHRVIVLRFFDGLRNKAVGQVIGMKEENVKNNIAHAMMAMRKANERYGKVYRNVDYRQTRRNDYRIR